MESTAINQYLLEIKNEIELTNIDAEVKSIMDNEEIFDCSYLVKKLLNCNQSENLYLNVLIIKKILAFKNFNIKIMLNYINNILFVYSCKDKACKELLKNHMNFIAERLRLSKSLKEVINLITLLNYLVASN